MRWFFLMWNDRVAEFPNSLLGNFLQPVGQLENGKISQQPIAKLAAPETFQTPSGKSGNTKIRQQAIGKSDALEIPQQPIGKSGPLQKGQTPSDLFGISETASRKLGNPFTISWSHYVLLLTIKDPGHGFRLQLADRIFSLFFPTAPPLSIRCVLNQRRAEINSLINSDAFWCQISGAACPA